MAPNALPQDPPPELEPEPSAKGWAALCWHLARRQLAAAESGDRYAVQLWARTANAIGALGKAFGAARELDEIRGAEREGLDEHGSLLLETFNEMRAVYGMAPMNEQQYERYKARFIGGWGWPRPPPMRPQRAGRTGPTELADRRPRRRSSRNRTSGQERVRKRAPRQTQVAAKPEERRPGTPPTGADASEPARGRGRARRRNGPPRVCSTARLGCARRRRSRSRRLSVRKSPANACSTGAISPSSTLGLLPVKLATWKSLVPARISHRTTRYVRIREGRADHRSMFVVARRAASPRCSSSVCPAVTLDLRGSARSSSWTRRTEQESQWPRGKPKPAKRYRCCPPIRPLWSWGLERKLIYRLARDKRIPHARAGRRLLFERNALRRWLSGDDQQKQAG